jgi:glycosyltransferase involved in cell wall biosynthesis
MKVHNQKIAIFTGSDLRSFGGGEKDVIGLVNAAKDLDITVFSLIDNKNARMTYDEIFKLLPSKSSVMFYSALKSKFLRDIFPISLSGVKVLFKLKQYHTVYSMHQGLFLNGLILIICKVYSVRFILGIHSPILFDDKPISPNLSRSFLMVFFSLYRNCLIRNIRFVRIQNSKDMHQLESKGFKGTAYNIPPHVFGNINVFSGVINTNKFVALFVGRLSVRHKGLDLLKDIVTNTLRQSNDIEFHVVGSGAEGEQIIKQLQTTFPFNFKWLGFLKEEDLEKEFINSSVFIFPSRGENFGISLAEAQAYGLPSVAFRVMGAEDIITENVLGTLVDPFDVLEFSNAILRYYELFKENPDKYLNLRKRISEITLSRYADDVMVSKMKSMFLPECSDK